MEIINKKRKRISKKARIIAFIYEHICGIPIWLLIRKKSQKKCGVV